MITEAGSQKLTGPWLIPPREGRHVKSMGGAGEVTMAWATRSQPEARSANTSLLNGVLFSYSVEIAAWTKSLNNRSKMALVTTDRHSNTTDRHIHVAMMALSRSIRERSHWENSVLRVSNVLAETRDEHWTNFLGRMRVARRFAEDWLKARNRKGWLADMTVATVDSANHYTNWVGMKILGVVPADWTKDGVTRFIRVCQLYQDLWDFLEGQHSDSFSGMAGACWDQMADGNWNGVPPMIDAATESGTLSDKEVSIIQALGTEYKNLFGG